jgi:hypothetical protein
MDIKKFNSLYGNVPIVPKQKVGFVSMYIPKDAPFVTTLNGGFIYGAPINTSFEMVDSFSNVQYAFSDAWESQLRMRRMSSSLHQGSLPRTIGVFIRKYNALNHSTPVHEDNNTIYTNEYGSFLIDFAAQVSIYHSTSKFNALDKWQYNLPKFNEASSAWALIKGNSIVISVTVSACAANTKLATIPYVLIPGSQYIVGVDTSTQQFVRFKVDRTIDVTPTLYNVDACTHETRVVFELLSVGLPL